MTTVADAAAFLDLPRPRRVAVAELVAQILSTERALAELYGRFADQAQLPALRASLARLAREKAEQVASLEPLGGLPADDRAPEALRASIPPGEPRIEQRAEMFLRAFEGERALEHLYREVAVLLADVGVPAELVQAAGRASRHRAQLRDLYVRYS
jgi:hypothetical protein